MSLIELPGYEEAFEGVFKANRVVRIIGEEDKSKAICAREVIGLQRHRVSYEEDVVDYILAKTRDLLENPDKYQKESDGLVALLKTLPEDDKKKIRDGDSDTLEFLRANTLNKKGIDGDISKEYLVITFGYTVDEMLGAIEDSAIDPNSRIEYVFRSLLCNKVKIGEDWTMKVLIYNPSLDDGLYDGVLPKAEQIKSLLKHGVLNSTTMHLSGLEPNNISRVYEIVKAGVTSDLEISEIMDVTDEILDNCARDPIKKFKEDKKQKQKDEKENKGRPLIERMQSILAKTVKEVPKLN